MKEAGVDRGRPLGNAEAAARLGLSPATLPAWRSRGQGPPYTKLGRSVRYFERDLAAWLEANAVTPEAAGA